MMYAVIIGAAVALSLVGAIMFLRQLRIGLTTTALHDSFNWGLYIQGFLYFSALGGGILIFIAVAILFELPSLQQIIERAAAVSLSCLICAGGLIGADMGKPFRGINLLKSKNFSSPLKWDFILLVVCGILNLMFCLGTISIGRPLAIFWAVICIMAALAYITIHTLFFLSRVGAGFSSRPFLGMDTIVHSLWGAGSLVTLITLSMGIPSEGMVKILLILTILVLISIFGAHMASLSTEGEGTNYKIVIWNGAILLLLLGDLLVGGGGKLHLVIVSMMILISVFLEKYHTLRAYQNHPTIPLPYSQFDEKAGYSPAVAEWLLLLGSIGACVWISSAIIYFRMI